MSRFWAVVAVAAVALGVLCHAVWGPVGTYGYLLGLVATGYDIVALWLIIRLYAKWELGLARPSIGAFGVVVAFFGKIPAFMYLGKVAQDLGGTAPNCFLIGLALVYCSLVGWALLRK